MTIDADPTQRRQLFQNLMSNGVKFRREDLALVVRVSTHLVKDQNSHSPRHPGDAQTFAIRVEDNGIGFDEKYVDRIFSIFQRLRGCGQYEATGIGLPICRKIAERPGGTMTARSTAGHGARLVVSLPVNQRAGAQVRRPKAVRPSPY